MKCNFKLTTYNLKYIRIDSCIRLSILQIAGELIHHFYILRLIVLVLLESRTHYIMFGNQILNIIYIYGYNHLKMLYYLFYSNIIKVSPILIPYIMPMILLSSIQREISLNKIVTTCNSYHL